MPLDVFFSIYGVFVSMMCLYNDCADKVVAFRVTQRLLEYM